MHQELVAYFYERVVEPWDIYSDHRAKLTSGKKSDLRLACDAAIALYHFKEHLKEITKIDPDIKQHCVEYKLVQDITNYAKHNVITKYKPIIFSKDDIFEQVFVTEYIDDKGIFYNARKEVVVRVDDQELIMINILTNVLNYWSVYLNKLGILENKKMFEIKERKVFRENEDGAAKLDLVVIAGVRFSQNIKMLKYNYDTNQEEVNKIDFNKS